MTHPHHPDSATLCSRWPFALLWLGPSASHLFLTNTYFFVATEETSFSQHSLSPQKALSYSRVPFYRSLSSMMSSKINQVFQTDPCRQSAPQPQVLTKPKRPLSSYNLFFQMERARIVGETPEDVACGRRTKVKHGKIAFQDLAKIISARWKNVDDETRAKLMIIAQHEKERYDAEMIEYRRLQQIEIEEIQREEAAREAAARDVNLEPFPMRRFNGEAAAIAELFDELDGIMTDIIISTFL